MKLVSHEEHLYTSVNEATYDIDRSKYSAQDWVIS